MQKLRNSLTVLKIVNKLMENIVSYETEEDIDFNVELIMSILRICNNNIQEDSEDYEVSTYEDLCIIASIRERTDHMDENMNHLRNGDIHRITVFDDSKHPSSEYINKVLKELYSYKNKF